MRTTLTVDDRVMKGLKELAHRSGKSFMQVVNETLELGLAATGSTHKEPYLEKPTRLGGARAGYDLAKALSLAEPPELSNRIGASLEEFIGIWSPDEQQEFDSATRMFKETGEAGWESFILGEASVSDDFMQKRSDQS